MDNQHTATSGVTFNDLPVIKSAHYPINLRLNGSPLDTDLSIPSPEPNRYEEDSDEADEIDEALLHITEANRSIPYTEPPSDLNRVKSVRSRKVDMQNSLLVFADQPTISLGSDRMVVRNHYGAGPTGQLINELKSTRPTRVYLVAFNFSPESLHAIEWTAGTMMRDGDQLHVVMAIQKKMNTKKQAEYLKQMSDGITKASKGVLEKMQMFDVSLITYAILGEVKSVLSRLMIELPLSMVICGRKKRKTIKGMIMGTISKFLVHQSRVPVTVIKPQTREKKQEARKIKEVSLNNIGQPGQLAVDELSNRSH